MEQQVFENSKKLLTMQTLLVHFDLIYLWFSCVILPPMGIGAVLAHRMPDGMECPIGYAFRTLSKAE